MNKNELNKIKEDIKYICSDEIKIDISERKMTEENFSFSVKDVFHYTGNRFKPWFSAQNKGSMKIEGYTEMKPGWYVDIYLEEFEREGKILKLDKEGRPQDYLIEINVKVTKLDRKW